MTNVIRNYSLLDTLKTGYKDLTAVGGVSQDLTKFLYSLPTLNVSGSSANNYAVTVSFANGVLCVNFIGGVRTATILSATLNLSPSMPYLFANTSGTFPVALQLDNNGTIAGQNQYILNSGAIVQFQFSGGNLA
jgi:hypothetical protein